MPVARHVVVSCLKSEVEDNLDAHEAEYELVGMTCYQVGSGYGAHVEVMLAFRLRPAADLDSVALPMGRQRRSPMQPITMRK